MTKLGRNDPCECSLGKKYKHCCLLGSVPFLKVISTNEKPNPSQGQAIYNVVRQNLDTIELLILQDARKSFGKKAFKNAVEELLLWNEVDLSELPEELGQSMLQFQLPYFMYQWVALEESEAIKNAPLETTPAQHFANSRAASKVPAALQEMLRAALEYPFSYFEIKNVNRGVGFLVQEFFTEEEYFIYESSGSRDAEVGTLLFARLVKIQGIHCFSGTGPFVLSKENKLGLIDLKEVMLKGEQRLLNWDDVKEWQNELQEEYSEYLVDCLFPKMPQVRNRDGDDIVLQTLHYDINNAHEAAQTLKTLCCHGDPDLNLTQHAKIDSAGKISSCHIAWSKLDSVHGNTSLGSIDINGNKLHCFVNSDNRASTFKLIMSEKLKTAKYKNTVYEKSVQDIYKESQRGESEISQSKALNPADFPELQAELQARVESHWQKWVDLPLPALGGIAPIEAVKTKFGREKVVALLESFEARESAGGPQYDYRKIMKRLGLEGEI